MLAEHFSVDETVAPDLPPRWNVAPTAQVFVIRERSSTEFSTTGFSTSGFSTSGFSTSGRSRHKRVLEVLRWGLVPSWAKDPSIGSRLINARAETLVSAPAFRVALATRRCIIPVDGFYEWKKALDLTRVAKGYRAAEANDGRPQRRPPAQPYFVTAADRKPLAIAGLWEAWRGAGGRWLRTCTIITTRANEALAPVHDRMPVILPEHSWDRWLDPDALDPGEADEILVAPPARLLQLYPVATAVNNVRNDGPHLVKPA